MRHIFVFIIATSFSLMLLTACGSADNTPLLPADQDDETRDTERADNEPAQPDGDRENETEAETEALAETDTEAPAETEMETESETETEKETETETEPDAEPDTDSESEPEPESDMREIPDDKAGIDPTAQAPAVCATPEDCSEGRLCVNGECVVCGKICAGGEYCAFDEQGGERCVVRPCGFPPMPSEVQRFSLKTVRRDWLRLSRQGRLWGFTIDPTSETLHVVTSDTAEAASAPEAAVIFTHSWTSLAPSAQSRFANDFFGAPKTAEGREEIARVPQALIDGPWLGYAQTAKQYALRFDAKGGLRFMPGVLDEARRSVPIFARDEEGWWRRGLDIGQGRWVKVFLDENGQAGAIRYDETSKDLVLIRETPAGARRLPFAALSDFPSELHMALSPAKLFLGYLVFSPQNTTTFAHSFFWHMQAFENGELGRGDVISSWLYEFDTYDCSPLACFKNFEYSNILFTPFYSYNRASPLAVSPIDGSVLLRHFATAVFITGMDMPASNTRSYHWRLDASGKACNTLTSSKEYAVVTPGIPFGTVEVHDSPIREVLQTFDSEGRTHITWRVNDDDGERRYYATDRFGAWATIRIPPEAAPLLEDGLFDAAGRFHTPRLKDAPEGTAQSILLIESTTLTSLPPSP